jgi:hypothetical protein
MKATEEQKTAKARSTTLVRFSIPVDLLRKLDDWASINYPGVEVREKAMLYLIKTAMEENGGTSVDLARG